MTWELTRSQEGGFWLRIFSVCVCVLFVWPTDRKRGGRASHAIGAPVKGQELIVFARGAGRGWVGEKSTGDSLVSV
jgi:hypothetical protein